MKVSLLYLILSLCIVITGCARVDSQKIRSYSHPDLEKALSGETIMGRIVDDSELPQLDLFGLTEEMKTFVTQATRTGRNQDEQAELLHAALITSVENGGRGIRYSVQATATAAGVFENRKANCLGHSLLYVALAKHIGLNAHINQVMVPPIWYMDDDETFLLMKHVNAKVKLRKFPISTGVDGRIQMTSASDIVIDLDMRRFRSTYKQILLGKEEVDALFYNNRAMEFLGEGNPQQAFRYLKRAIKAQPDASFVWSNLGSLYRRQNQLVLAEVAYQKALSLDEADLTVLHNLEGLYKHMGRSAEAVAYNARVQKYRESNPYYLYQMAVQAKNKEDWSNAKKFIHQALAKQKTDERFYQMAAEVYEHEGLMDKASKMRSKAKTLEYQNMNGQLQAET